uniref:Transposase n=1 Tax=Heterorhabditis bacteriophora TaxID=37862 RepID=A0A1I7X8L9_HETBA
MDRIWKVTQKEHGNYNVRTNYFCYLKSKIINAIEMLIDSVKESSSQEFNEYVDTVFTAHRASRHGYDE